MLGMPVLIFKKNFSGDISKTAESIFTKSSRTMVNGLQ